MKKVLSFMIIAALLLCTCGAMAQEGGEQWIADRAIVARAFSDDIGSSLPDDQASTPVAKEIKRLTGVDFSWEYTSGNNDLEVMTTMLAVGDIPDVIIGYLDDSGRPEFSVLLQAVQAGMLLDMTPYLGNTEVLKSYLDPAWLPSDAANNILRNEAYPDDGIYVLQMRIPRYEGSVPRDDVWMYMNMDVAKAAGIDPAEITTTESLIEAARKIKAANLTDKNGEPVMPIGPTVWGGRLESTYYYSAAISDGRQSLFGVVDGKVLHQSGTDLLGKQVNYVRQMLDEELIDPEVFTMASARCQENFIAGHYGIMVMNAWQANDKFESTGIEWLPMYHLTSRDGVEGIYQTAKSASYFLAINADVENPQEVIDFIDFMSSREGKLLWGYGIEGVHYDLDEKGFPVIRQEWWDLADADSNKALLENTWAMGSAYGWGIGRTDLAWHDDFGADTVGRSDPATVAHTEYIRGYGDPAIHYYTGSKASAFFYKLPESTQINLEQFIDPSYHADMFVKSCFAGSDDEAAKILADYRTLLEKQGIAEMEALLQSVYDTAPGTVHFH